MAKLTSLLLFIGTLAGIPIYKMERSKEPIVHQKSGTGRDNILHHASFVNMRRFMNEFRGRSTAKHMILQAIRPLQTCRGTTGKINYRLSVIQKMDTRNMWGLRAVAPPVAPGCCAN